jgi:hypothetical protein
MTDSTLPQRRPDEVRPEGDATGGVIPYKNPKALIAYYCGIFSLMPCIGIGPGIAGVVLGIMGLKHRALHPETKGSVHAWIGIILGGAMTLIWGLMIVLGIVAAMQAPN